MAEAVSGLVNPEAPLKVIITGGAGCVGFATIQALLRQYRNATIHVLDIVTPPSPSQDNKNSDVFFKLVSSHSNSIHYHNIDITDAPALNTLFKTIKPQAIIHTASVIPSAARKQKLSNARLWHINVDGTKNVLNAAKLAGSVQALVYTSSCDAVKPDSWMDFANATEAETAHLRDAQKWDSEYPRTKAEAEKLVLIESHPFKTCAIRTHGVTGILDQNLIPLIATSPRKISLGSGKNLYDFSSAENVAQAHVLAMNNLLSVETDVTEESNKTSANGRAFFVSDGTPMPFRELQEMVWRVFDEAQAETETETETGAVNTTVAKTILHDTKFGNYAVIPVWLFASVARFARLLGLKTQISVEEIGDAVSVRYFDISEARRVLGYDPSRKTLEDSIRDACRWWMERK